VKWLWKFIDAAKSAGDAWNLRFAGRPGSSALRWHVEAQVDVTQADRSRPLATS
jgi:hypothetical protein